MVNTSTNINKTNNHLSLSHLTQKIPRHMMLEIRAMACDRYKNVAELNLLMGSQIFHLDNRIFNGNTNDNKSAKIRCHSKRPHTITKKTNKKQYKHGQYNSRVNECSQLTDCKRGVYNMLVKDHYSYENIHRLYLLSTVA